MEYVVCVPTPTRGWGFDYPALTTFEALNDEKAIAIFRHHKALAQNTSKHSKSFLVSGGVYWKSAILCRSGYPKAIAGPDDTPLYNVEARSVAEEKDRQTQMNELKKKYH